MREGAAPIAGLAAVFAARLLDDGIGCGAWRMWARYAGLPTLGALCVITIGILMARGMR